MVAGDRLRNVPDGWTPARVTSDRYVRVMSRPLSASALQCVRAKLPGPELDVSMIVPIIVFLSLQRYFVRGITGGAVKG